MTPAERHARLAGTFSDRVDGVSDWDAPAPVPGWTARDVIGHLVGWLPGFLSGGGISWPSDGPGVADDPVGAWQAHAAAVQGLLEGPDADRPFEHPMVGGHRLATAIDQFYSTDVFLHTWDLARASGQDATLDPTLAGEVLAGMQPFDAMLRASGQYGPKIPVADDAPVTDRLMGFIGRDPTWQPPT